MMSADETTPDMASGRRKAVKPAEPSGKRSEKRSRKPREKAATQPDQGLQEVQEPLAATIASAGSLASDVPMTEAFADIAPPTDIAPTHIAPDDTAPDDTAPVAAAPLPPVSPSPVSYQTITDAYGDYTRRSIEQTNSFLAQLAGARSLDSAFELQTAYARQAYDTFIAESQRIRELHRELTRQRLKRFEGLVMRMTRSR